MAERVITCEAGGYDIDGAFHKQDGEITLLLSEKTSVLVDHLIKKFAKEIPKLLPKEQKLESLREQFVNDFTMNKLRQMTKEEYVVGLGRKDSFCYRLETELRELGDIHSVATSAKFGLYYGKSGEDTEEKYRCTKKFGENPDDALEKIKQEIVFLRMNGEKKDIEAIRKCELSPVFRGKILSVFYPEDFLCIFSEEHLDYFLGKLDLVISPDDDTLAKQRKLVDWKNQRPEMKSWNNHLFSCFLYASFGSPFEDERAKKDTQAERDKAYPRDYVANVKITLKQWKELLRNPDVFQQEDIALLKRFYLADNHAAACHDLGVQDGISPSSYITPVVSLAKRISKALELEPVYGEGGRQVWWRIPFWGRYREDGKFEWKLRPKLAKAMAELFPELSVSVDIRTEEQEDHNLVDELKQANVGNMDGFEYKGEPKKKTVPVYTNGHKVYPRDRQTSINALAHAHYECEIDGNHPTFIRKKSDKKYTEPHHLVPVAFSNEFHVSLDVEENIVSLCSNCHNQIHYGKDADLLLRKLYEERREALERVGIKLTLNRLLDMYGY